MKIAVVGATGVVGQEMIRVLLKHGYKNIDTFASSSSLNKQIVINGHKFIIRETTEENLNKNYDFILWATESNISKRFIPNINSTHIDNSSAFRMDKNVPLIVPEINGNILSGKEKIIANPNCSTAIMLMGILPFIKHDLIDTLFVSTYQAVSGAGINGILALEEESKGQIYNNSPFQFKIHNNIIPFIGNSTSLPYSGEEIKMIEETKKITGKNFHVIPTCVRVPVKRSHSEAISIILKKDIHDINEIKKLYKGLKGVKITDIPESPLKLAEQEYVSVSRIRIHPEDKKIVSLWVVGDNLWKGAALNAVQILDYIVNNIKH